jgi:hypothetical protein
VPTFSWLLEFDNAITPGTSKWRFIGGVPGRNEMNAAGSIAPNVAASYGDSNTGAAFPSFTVPVAGSYSLTFGCGMFASVQASTPFFLAPKLGATATADADGFRMFFTLANQIFTASRSITRTLAASDLVKLQLKATGTTGTGSLENAWLYVTPVLLG